jgi:endoglucanase
VESGEGEGVLVKLRLLLVVAALVIAGTITIVVTRGHTPVVTTDQRIAVAAGTQQCDQYARATVGGKYIMQNNHFSPGTGQCNTVTDTGFQITSQTDSITADAPLSYSSLYIGCHYSNCSPGTNLPMPLSQIGSAPSSISYGYVPGGTYDAAYDIWMDSTAKTDGVNQMELMIWFNHVGDKHPVGSAVADSVRIGGQSWQVWQGNNHANDVVSYLAPSPISTWSFNVMDFVGDLMKRTSVTDKWYLTSVQAGFEVWSGGAGLSVNSFSADVQTGSGGKTGGDGAPGANPALSGKGQELVGQASGRCLDIKDFGTADPTPVQLWDCLGGTNQMWISTGGILYNPQSNKCLDVKDAGTANGTEVRLWSCDATYAQQWQLNSNGTITNTESGKCLDAVEQGNGNGTGIQIWDCYGGGTQANQVWGLH